MASAYSISVTLVLSLLVLIAPAHSQTCSSQTFSANRAYALCSDLPQLSSQIHWTYDSSKSLLHIAFVAPPPKSTGWIAWAINPTRKGMVGAQSLIAFQQSNGSMTVKTFDVKAYGPIQPSKIAFEVSDMGAEFSNGVMRIFATLALPKNMTTVNQVWQVGSSVTNSIPGVHAFDPANKMSMGTLDLLKGQSTATGSGGGFGVSKKNIHGVLNTVSWGILFPVGVIIARYVRTFPSADPAWFYLHVSCQFSAYVIGVAGWATGLKLGSESKGIQYSTHRYLGIALFTLATIQMFAMFLRPKKDHKYRTYWNIYHYSVGYSVIIMGIINVFKGLEMLNPAKKWKTAYIILLAILGAISLLLEVITWSVVLRRKSSNSTKLYDGSNTPNGNNRSRQQLSV
eukprot:TRINITY_DN19193_c0_g1_i1.p1 TRINITY_DN19193_c0_g1~~TRINITY_DN19193_c0_g1_i1.p1  ORF type:complete len:398 (+),score=43.14 TRINITY_DN19193_c0_g1_i1:322-1515(+)